MQRSEDAQFVEFGFVAFELPPVFFFLPPSTQRSLFSCDDAAAYNHRPFFLFFSCRFVVFIVGFVPVATFGYKRQ